MNGKKEISRRKRRRRKLGKGERRKEREKKEKKQETREKREKSEKRESLTVCFYYLFLLIDAVLLGVCFSALVLWGRSEGPGRFFFVYGTPPPTPVCSQK